MVPRSEASTCPVPGEVLGQAGLEDLCPASAPWLVLLRGRFLLACGLPPGPAVCPGLDCANPWGACRQSPAWSSLPSGNADLAVNLSFTWTWCRQSELHEGSSDFVQVAPSASRLLLTCSSPPIPPVCRLPARPPLSLGELCLGACSTRSTPLRPAQHHVPPFSALQAFLGLLRAQCASLTRPWAPGPPPSGSRHHVRRAEQTPNGRAVVTWGAWGLSPPGGLSLSLALLVRWRVDASSSS